MEKLEDQRGYLTVEVRWCYEKGRDGNSEFPVLEA
jgi:hypothetical protein